MAAVLSRLSPILTVNRVELSVDVPAFKLSFPTDVLIGLFEVLHSKEELDEETLLIVQSYLFPLFELSIKVIFIFCPSLKSRFLRRLLEESFPFNTKTCLANSQLITVKVYDPEIVCILVCRLVDSSVASPLKFTSSKSKASEAPFEFTIVIGTSVFKVKLAVLASPCVAFASQS